MKQAALDQSLSVKKTRKRESPEQMEKAVSWVALVEHIAPCDPMNKKGRPPFSLETMLRHVGLCVVDDAGLRQALIERGRERIKIFSWEQCAHQTMAVYEKVLSNVH